MARASPAVDLTGFAADVYILGIILYEMLTAVAPFNGETPLAIALKQVSEEPRAPREIVVSIPAALERVVLHTLRKNPIERPRDAHELRRELHATAEGLGLEHADSSHTPTMDDLRSAGNESPSGRLVIDLNTLRQVQAVTGSAPAVSEQTATAQTSPTDSNRPAFNRMNVSLERQPAKRSHLIIAVILLVIAILGSGVLAARWWRQNPGFALQANATLTPTATPTPTPSPSPAANAAPARGRKQSRPSTEKPSAFKSVVNKLKKILP